MNLPLFVCAPLVNIAFAKVLEKYKIDLKSLDFSDMKEANFPTLFIYSEIDEIVDYSHSISIM